MFPSFLFPFADEDHALGNYSSVPAFTSMLMTVRFKYKALQHNGSNYV